MTAAAAAAAATCCIVADCDEDDCYIYIHIAALSFCSLIVFESVIVVLVAARSERMENSHSQLTQLLTSAGFSAEQAAQALAATGGNVEAAMNW